MPRERAPRVARRAVIVIGTDHDVSLRMPVSNGLCDRHKVTRMECDSYRMASSLMNARSSCETLGDANGVQSYVGAAGTSDLEAVALDRSVLEESLDCTHTDELQAMQLARRVAHRNDQRTPVHA